VGSWLAAWLPALSCLLCPICLTASAGLASSLGVGFLLEGAAHDALVSTSLMVAIASIGWTAGRRGRVAPLLLSLVGAGAIGIGHHAFEIPAVELAGMAFLIGGSAWNLRSRRSQATAITDQKSMLKV
jgi:hypothetical protein